MSHAPVPPSFGANSFSCPHCGAFADQHWFKVMLSSQSKEETLTIFTSDIVEEIRKKLLDQRVEDANPNSNLLDFVRRFDKNHFTYWISQCNTNSHWDMISMAVSRCHSCDAFAVWIEDSIVFPSHDIAVVPNDDMPADVRIDFLEAAEIVNKSPRGSAALLRLAIQKLMPHIEEDGRNLNTSIASLVKKGLDKKVQQALDIVRVTGNNAVHPGELDLKDDKATAMQLFALVNIVVQSTISAKAQIEAMYTSLPLGALQAIEKRDT
jgi:hypothetical protein